jgi:hypothetical protein
MYIEPPKPISTRHFTSLPAVTPILLPLKFIILLHYSYICKVFPPEV